MPLSSRLATAVHVIAILIKKGDAFVKSEEIAESVNTNPVVIRKILMKLSAAGFISTHSGSHGGAKLKVCPKEITLFDVYNAVEEEKLFAIHEGNPDCPMSYNLKKVLESKLELAEESMKKELSKVTLKDVFNDTNL